ncbi:hypothetical protein O181_113012 [Austropuccinia psidii MF-1]|uniref:DUF4939 domain-containing protein n=1 Tax=Austropuccinia psidii MF-1 TaxID=1389203 RepID=A0A9Q3K2V5_9BASI|nr:hypothetical protein [Austropuccinia psidii MF-1]
MKRGRSLWKRRSLNKLKWKLSWKVYLRPLKLKNLAHYNQPLFSQAEPNLLKILEHMTQFMGQLTQAVAHRENSKAAAFKTPSMKEPACFDGSQAHRFRVFIQSCQLIFHNDPANFFSGRKKVLYSTYFITGRACKWIER